MFSTRSHSRRGLDGMIWIMGQSNASGAGGQNRGNEYEPPSPLIGMFDKADQWRIAEEPNASARGVVDSVSDDGIAFLRYSPRAIEAVADNGSGLYRLTVTGHGYTGSSLTTRIADSVGAAALNGDFGVTTVNVNLIDLQGSDSTGAPGWVPGTGTTNVWLNHHSPWTLCAKRVMALASKRLGVLPCSKGGTLMRSWLPAEDRFDATTLFGSSNRRRLACGVTPACIVYFGHESSALTSGEFPNYVAEWTQLMSEFRAEVPDIPVIYAQLAMHERSTGDASPSDPDDISGPWERMFQAREHARSFEDHASNTSPNKIPGLHMVTAFDLPLRDGIHVDRDGVDILSERFARAIAEHVYGIGDGTGPRFNPSFPVAVIDSTNVAVVFDRAVTVAGTANDQFRVWDNNAAAWRAVTGVSVTTSFVANDTIVVTVGVGFTGLPTVTYGQTFQNSNGVTLADVVKDVNGLPAPAFKFTAVA